MESGSVMPTCRKELTDLADTGAKALVASIGTDLWPTVRKLIRRVLIWRTPRRAESAEVKRSEAERFGTISQTNTAYGSSRLYANQHGSQHIYIHHDDSDE